MIMTKCVYYDLALSTLEEATQRHHCFRLWQRIQHFIQTALHLYNTAASTKPAVDPPGIIIMT